MALPDLIEIVPLVHPVRAAVTVPGSKSITNRALVLAALGDGETTLEGALWSEDTQVMVDCLQELGFMVNVVPDPAESSNRTISVYGLGGKMPRGGTEDNPLELFVGNAGTAARFLSAMVCLGQGSYRLHGIARMHERPQAALFQALRQLGYRVDSANDKLPAIIHGSGPRAGECSVSIEESSQFASALLLCARAGNWLVNWTGENAEESPYVAMTRQLREAFPNQGGRFQIEPDASSGSYFWAANIALPPNIEVAHWPKSGWQIDQAFPHFLSWFIAQGSSARGGPPGAEQEPRSHCERTQLELPAVSRLTDLGDSIMTAIVLAPFARQTTRFTDLGRLRVQECERVQALRTELTRCGAEVLEHRDSLMVSPSAARLHGAKIETYEDHRMAMCFAVLGLRVPGMQIKNPACVRKTFPDFFQKLAEPPPTGLGVKMLDPATGRVLAKSELFAEG